jgi:hypothetical protein
MNDSTNILELPTDPVGGGSISNNNIRITAQEVSKSTNIQSPETDLTREQLINSNMTLDQNTINQIVSSLQQASLTGATQLQSRDIPMTTTSLSNDPQIIPNYVPPYPNNTDYIRKNENNNDIIHNYNKKNNMNNSLDDIYNEIQTPLLLAVLYFLFQLPFFKNFLYKYLPLLFSNDGNYNIKGFLFVSVLFGLLFHFLMKFTGYFSPF